MNDGTRLLNILGVEEDEKFTTKITCNTYRVHHGLLQYEDSPESWCTATCATLCQLINEPSFVIHKPRFSDEEMTFLRLLHKYGYAKKIINSESGTYICTSNSECISDNIGKNLLKYKETIELDEMFGAEND